MKLVFMYKMTARFLILGLAAVSLLAFSGVANGSPELIQAVEECDLQAVTRLLKDGADVNALDDEKHTPLMLAAAADPEQLAEESLIEAVEDGRADADDVEKFAKKLSSARKEIVRLLLEKGGKIDAQDESGITALHYALAGNQVSIAKYLLERGASFNTRSNVGITPLISAASSESAELFYMLVEKGADMKVVDDEGTNLLMFATEEGNEKMLQFLIDKGLDVNAANKSGKTALFNAAILGDVPLVKFLLSKGANPHHADAEGKLAIDWATENGNVQAARVLKAAMGKQKKREE